MKNCISAIAILIFFIIIMLVGCSNPTSIIKSWFEEEKSDSLIVESTDNIKENNELRDTVLYYKDDKEFLVPVMRKLPWNEGRGIAKAALKAIVDTPANREDIKGIGLLPTIPANTEINGMTIRDGLCKVDFTADILNYTSKKEEEALIQAIVYTLTEFATIDNVQIMVDGKAIDHLKYGTNIADSITRQNINSRDAASGGDAVVVYFEGTANGLETYFVPITVSVEKQEDATPNVLDALDILVKGPPNESGLFSSIPQGTRVVSVDVNDSIAHINVTEEILDVVKNKNVMDSVARAFGLTVKEQYKDVVGVKILVNGEELEEKGDGKEEPIVVPTFANQY